MTTIYIKTKINAPVIEVFDLSRDIDFHMYSAKKTNEKAISGTTSRLIGLGETVKWRGKHFGIYLTHQSKITCFEYPNKFTDEMITGHFTSFKHQHIFHKTTSGTEMIDILEYEPPYSIFGALFNITILKRHLTHFLTSRNLAIKLHLETKNHEV